MTWLHKIAKMMRKYSLLAMPPSSQSLRKGRMDSVGSLADLYAPVQNAFLQGPATPGDFDVGGPNIAVKGMSFELSEI